MKIYSNSFGLLFKKAAMPIYGKNLQKNFFSTQGTWNLETWYKALLTLGLPSLFKWWFEDLPLSFLWKGQCDSPLHSYGKKYWKVHFLRTNEGLCFIFGIHTNMKRYQCKDCNIVAVNTALSELALFIKDISIRVYTALWLCYGLNIIERP